MLLNQPEGGWQEGAGIVLAMVVLLLAFGSYLAAGLPILVSLCELAISYSVIHFLASMFEIAPTAPMVAAMLGIGAGIDYALFIVTRYRQQLAEGDDVETAVGRAMAHAGNWSAPRSTNTKLRRPPVKWGPSIMRGISRHFSMRTRRENPGASGMAR